MPVVLIVRRNLFARVVVRSSPDLTVRIHQLPILPAVVGAPQLPALRRLSVHWHTVAGFNQRINTVGVPLRHTHRNPPDRRLRQPLALPPLSRPPAVARIE